MTNTFLVPGDGATDAGPLLRAAISQANNELQLGPGVYLVGTIPHPHNAAFQVGLIIPPNFHLRGSSDGGTVIRLLPRSPNQAYLALNLNFDGGSSNDENISFENITFDGFATQQNQLSNIDAQYGPTIQRARHITFRNCSGKNFFATTSGGNGPNGTNGESYCFDTLQCTDVLFINCRAYNDAGQGGDGFHTNSGCTSVQYLNCLAYGSSKGHGFAAFQCGQLTYVNCQSWLNAAAGFDIELSQDVLLEQCIAGSVAGPIAGYPYTANQVLGNTLSGINLRGNARVNVVSCVGSNNGSHGLAFYFTGATGLRLFGGRFTNNGIYGIFSDGNQTDVVIEGHPIVTGNTTGGLTPNNGTLKVLTAGQVTSPGVPATTVGLANPYPFACLVSITGGTVTVVAVDGVTLYTASPCTVYLAPWSTITLTYSSAPTWNWAAA